MTRSIKSFIYIQVSWLIVGTICGGIKQKAVGDIGTRYLVYCLWYQMVDKLTGIMSATIKKKETRRLRKM